jgi:hypothetical protein
MALLLKLSSVAKQLTSSILWHALPYGVMLPYARRGIHGRARGCCTALHVKLSNDAEMDILHK